ncbi:5-methylthioadenosine/S-adenosylhomocysteine deaminase [Kroppenstedtia guangzhouensis]|uniref:5-methylthioadenosine/S-adenosylhomocysteine deaminase n=1 Tax=Kroppenstedtia guangzhouensis TaxID=1274356 RepID=A0ABQ1G7T2_9BACL|nr:amidohydrolase [Kroppenstedtia guangzhouensis]GGA38467.1 5-methylthioadenosine/S-adenosylhomocysteine deaminase [Kroppenstedtia guangzhouensis]
MKRLLTHARILTMKEEESRPLENAWLLIDGEIIAQVGTGNPEIDADEVVNMQGRLLLPGWVNTHGHAAMTLLRGFADDLPLKIWLEEKMWPMEERFGPRQVRWGTSLAVAEMIRGGTTCFTDMYDHMDDVADVVAQSGIRASLCRGVIGLGSREEQEAKRQEAIRFVRDWNGGAGGRISVMMAPHAPYTCPPDYIEKLVADSAELGVPIHIHMSETQAEVEQNLRDYNARPVAHLRRLGVFDRPCLVAHAVHLTTEEIGILAEKDVKVSHNPGSNLKLGSGIAPIPEMLKAGIRPSLGTDGAASNNNLDLMEEVRLAALIHKGVRRDPEAVPAETALRMGTLYGAEALFLEDQIGTLEAGKQADLISIDLNGAHLQPLHDPVSHLVYAASRDDVQDVYVAGRPLMRNRELLTLDEEKIRFEANRAFAKVAP